jgi:hypothetical protein
MTSPSGGMPELPPRKASTYVNNAKCYVLFFILPRFFAAALDVYEVRR